MNETAAAPTGVSFPTALFITRFTLACASSMYTNRIEEYLTIMKRNENVRGKEINKVNDNMYL